MKLIWTKYAGHPGFKHGSKKSGMEGKTKQNDLNTENVLKRLLEDKHSKLYLCKNVLRIKQFLLEHGIDVDKRDIKAFVSGTRSNSQILNNFSKRKTAEIGKGFENSQQYGRIFHSDLLVLSKLRKYRTNKYYILTLIDSLSGFTFIELLSSKKAYHVVDALDHIFKRCNWLSSGQKTIISDLGSEYRNSLVKNWAKLNNVKFSMVKYRPYRGSKGSTKAENKNRVIRKLIESVLVESKSMPFSQVIIDVEKLVNNQAQPTMNNLSAKSIIQSQDPRYIAMLRLSNRYLRRKYVRRAINSKSRIELYSIVRIRLNTQKSIFVKESYGKYSQSLFIVIGIEESNLINYYRLGNLFLFKEISNCTYSSAELLKTGISYARACYLETLTTAKLLRKLEDGMIEICTAHDNTKMIATERILSYGQF